MTARVSEHPNYNGVASLDHIAFWEPLPSSATLDETGQQFLRQSDADIRNGRYESALDVLLALNATAPDYVPGFIRTAELLIATRRKDRAGMLLQTILKREQIFGSNEFDLALSKVQAHVELDPDLLLTLARSVLERGDEQMVVPYVPVAIEQLTNQERYPECIQLAEAWVAAAPASPLALSFLVRAQLYAGDSEAAGKTIRRYRDAYDADRLWPENTVVSALVAIASSDSEPKWMAAGPVCLGLRDRSLNYEHATALLEFLIPSLASPQRALLFAGLLAINAGDHQEAQPLFETTLADTPIETYLRSVGLERTTPASDDSGSRFNALKDIWQTLSDPQVVDISNSSNIFDPPATRSSVGLEVARILRETEAYSDALTLVNELVRHGHTEPEIVRLQAEIMGQVGSGDDALATLDSLLQQQESSHRYADAIETLETMIRLVPGNIRFRARLVDNCLKVGRFDQAIDQLVMQGRLLHKSGRVTEAEAPVHRAIEIATMTSDWDKVNKLHRLLISFAPEETRVRHAAVTTYVQYGRTAEALGQLREIVRIARKRDELDEAIAASHQMLALDPNDPATYHQLGELLVSIQEYHQADRVYRRLASMVPDDPAVQAKRSAIAALSRSRQSST